MNSKCPGKVRHGGVCPGFRKRVVVDEDVLVASGDRCTVAVADGDDLNVAYSLPVANKLIEFDFVLWRQFCRQYVEPQIENVTLVLYRSRLSQHLRLGDRRSLPRLHWGIEDRHGARRNFTVHVSRNLATEFNQARPGADLIG